MRTSIRSTLALLALLPLASVAGAQSAGSATRPERLTLPREPIGVGAMTDEASARVASRLADADTLTQGGRFVEARVLLRDVIETQVAAKAYPGAALRRLANVEFALSRPIAAAHVLEELARAAKVAGEPEDEIGALTDAMIIYVQVGRKTRAGELKPRVRRLLDHPGVSAETRRAIAPYVM